jgi:hypothetical protein
VWLEGLDQLKKIHLIGTQTCDLPACSIVPQPITLPLVEAGSEILYCDIVSEHACRTMIIRNLLAGM